MITVRTSDTPDQMECRLSGQLTQIDYEQTLIPALEKALSATDHLRFLLIFDNDVSGMDAGAVWADAKMGLAHWRGFDRIAVVADQAFVRVATRLVAPLIPCPAQVFSHAQMDAARLWLRESLGTIHLTELAPGTVELRLLGSLDAEAYARTNENLAAHVTQGEEFRLLLDLRQFDGWQGPAAMLAHLHTAMAHVGQAKRIAMVGAAGWQHAAEAIGQRLLQADVTYFDAAQYVDARKWVMAKA